MYEAGWGPALRRWHPKVGAPCVKNDCELLTRCSNLNFAEILRVLDINNGFFGLNVHQKIVEIQGLRNLELIVEI